MQLFLTNVLPFLAHDHPAAVAFLTCCYHNFHSSIIPEFLSDEERVKSFCEVRQKDQLKANGQQHHNKLYNLFVQTPLMQFSPSLVLQNESWESILKPLLATKYFSRTLQKCSLTSDVPLTNDLLQGLSKVQSLTKFFVCEVKTEQLEIIINSFPSLEILTISRAQHLEIIDSKTAINISSPSASATKSLRNLTLCEVRPLFATRFVSNFLNLKKLELRAQDESRELLDLRSLSSSLPLLTDLHLKEYTLKNTDSLKNLVHLSTLEFISCDVPDLSFLTQQKSLPELTTLRIYSCDGLLSSSLAPLRFAPNLHVLQVYSENFNNDCLQYLENMVHLRKLELSYCHIVGDSRALKSLMQNVFQLEELNLSGCYEIGNRGAIAGALYSIHSRLRVLNLHGCYLVDDDLNGIGLLKNTLEVLHLTYNSDLTNEALMHCSDLVKLKILNFGSCINDLTPLKDCLNLEELNVAYCGLLTDDSFKVFSEEPTSFPNLRVLNLSFCRTLTQKVFEHLAKNNSCVYQLKELNVTGMFEILSSSKSARDNLCQLQGLRILNGVLPDDSSSVGLRRLTGYFSVESSSDRNKLKDELLQRLKNLEEIE